MLDGITRSVEEAPEFEGNVIEGSSDPLQSLPGSAASSTFRLPCGGGRLAEDRRRLTGWRMTIVTTSFDRRVGGRFQEAVAGQALPYSGRGRRSP